VLTNSLTDTRTLKSNLYNNTEFKKLPPVKWEAAFFYP